MEVGEAEEAEEEESPASMASKGLINKETKEAVVTGRLADAKALKDWLSQRDASDSGVCELRKMSKSGIHASIFVSSAEHSTAHGPVPSSEAKKASA